MEKYYQNQVNHNELINVFHLFFGGAMYSNEYKICFKKRDSASGRETSIDVLYSKKYNIKNIIDSELTVETKIELEEVIKKALVDSQKRKVARYICFSNQKLEGAFSFQRIFQVIPLPEDAPSYSRNTSLRIRYWPIILEFEYFESTCSSINYSFLWS